MSNSKNIAKAGGSVSPRLLRRDEIGAGRRFRMRARLLQAAAQVIGRNGTDHITIDDFIIAAGVSRGTFYNHFESRQALLDELWRVTGMDPFRDIGTIAGRIECPAARFAATSRMVLRRALKDSTWGWLVVALSASEATLTEDLRTYPVPDIREAKRSGRFKYDDEKAAVDLVVGTMRAGLRTLLEEGKDAAYADSLCRMMLLALGVGSSEARRLSTAPLSDGCPF